LTHNNCNLLLSKLGRARPHTGPEGILLRRAAHKQKKEQERERERERERLRGLGKAFLEILQLGAV
jgi:hypothetical protein